MRRGLLIIIIAKYNLVVSRLFIDFTVLALVDYFAYKPLYFVNKPLYLLTFSDIIFKLGPTVGEESCNFSTTPSVSWLEVSLLS